ncbi:MAG: carbohydrate ABC transporter permease [Christensenellaceae bacterium]|nr:carbohydrate ABC transporter permease [Christensenellaceae bacterium]
MVPFMMVILNSAKTSAEIMNNPISMPNDWGQLITNVRKIFESPITDYVGAFFDSLIITVSSLAIIVIFSSMAAWVLVRNKTKWSTFVYMSFVAAMVIPFQVVMFPLVQWFNMIGKTTGIPMLNSYQGLLFAYLGFGCSLSIFILYGFVKGIPLALEEAATIDGCSQPRIFFNIVIPLLQPVVVTVLILNGIWIWNDYLLPLLLLGPSGKIQTMPLAVTAFAGAFVKQWDLILTSALLAMLPIIVLFIFAQRYIMKGMVDGAVK